MATSRTRMLRRVAADITPGMRINLGIGLPSLVIDYLPQNSGIGLHTENGLVGIGASSPDVAPNRNLIDSGGNFISTVPGSAFLDSAVSFAIVRSGRLDLTLMGAFEVASNGDLANWKIPGKFSPGPGGAIELAQKARRVGIVMAHTNRDGRPKIVGSCSLPLTAAGCVNRIYTEMAVLDVTDRGLTLVAISQDTTFEELCKATGAPILVPSSQVESF